MYSLFSVVVVLCFCCFLVMLLDWPKLVTSCNDQLWKLLTLVYSPDLIGATNNYSNTTHYGCDGSLQTTFYNHCSRWTTNYMMTQK
jgi:hypothetical protein